MTFAKLTPMADYDRARAPARPSRPAPAAASATGKMRGPGALALCAGLTAAWMGLVGGRAQIVKIVPGAAPVYAALGLKVNLRQMDVLGVTARLVEEDGRKILLVEGQIKNIDANPRTPPRMRLAVEDGQGREIYFWTAAPPKSRLSPGENAYFRARLAAPPDEGAEVRVRFAPEASAT
ncbi:hypothetical protein CCR94_09080 [Rhodoblastus sphagnicola]|uniref:DUF3426 domain-containing protein n=1 Tax=Rhodoblastus sphagnicola TaxID=333368 RepID=A0A2S6NA03_9HYPH|nr:DUF3426 domain-containing protein [Rhodoblastus sphagnicola]MBB4198818.1 hypothetical protein [Rhodoblastus sphagnicola]PPQ31444.1 hypothetical protein CCR94_09080 [Rhodoblastus sphagnicola]